ncbi:tyrosine-type recombinase/integrase [Thioclava electrotropha]|uniref:Tyrosine-type recombinase/integrase n=1 Tax=Thioclava electrotropha TaxID=1549850 RepID=A0ABX6YPE9_9RHOB|nr:tyrosine-type recombinase/integrase [Thioclava electrotropha]QPZ89694.1 tyrosine-type recombinase/integrase [Thioclava electrotropha]
MSLILPIEDWPEADRVMWATLRAQGGPLDDHGALAHLRASSLETLGIRYGRWLGWLSRTERDALRLPPAERASLPRLQAWLADLAHTAPMTRLMFVDGVIRVLSAAAPDADWVMHRRLRGALKLEAGRGEPTRKRGRIVSTRVLLEAGLHHAGPLADAAETPLEAMKRRRDGTMIALLALMPMRRRSFCELTLGQSVLVMNDEITISLSEEMTKTGVAWEASVPWQVEPVLRRYIEDVRPYLMARGNQDHARLWVGKKGEIPEENYLGSRIGDLTLQLTGKRIPPHFFRDAAATTLARLSPDAARLIRPVLAHSGFKTAERHYIHAQTIEAGRDYAALVKSLKGGKS